MYVSGGGGGGGGVVEDACHWIRCLLPPTLRWLDAQLAGWLTNIILTHLNNYMDL